MADQTLAEHPSKEALIGYLTEPEAGDYAAIHLHVCRCPSCSRKVRKMEAVLFGIAPSSPYRTAVADSGMKAVPKVPKMAADETSPLGNAPRPSNRQATLWMAIPASLAATVLLVLAVVVPWGTEDSGIPLAVYHDSANLRFSPSSGVPSLGFFENAQVETAPYSGVSIAYSDGRYRMSWPPVQNVVEYRFAIFRIDGDRRKLVAEAQARAPQMTLEADEPEQATRYTWRLSGETSDGQVFEHEGGFVRSDS